MDGLQFTKIKWVSAVTAKDSLLRSKSSAGPGPWTAGARSCSFFRQSRP